MKELRIPMWTGLCDAEGKMILGLGNDIYQIAIAIAEGVETGAAKVTFNEADHERKHEYGADGIIDLFPSLRSGIELREGEVSEVETPLMITRHWQMAEQSSSVLREALVTYFKPYITDSLANERTYEDTLVIHLRGGDALNEWEQRAWRPSPAPYELYRDAIERAAKPKILIVTTPPENGKMHPFIDRIRQEFGAEVQHGTLLEDFSVLINCSNLVIDFSTFGYTAALMNTNLRNVFISKYVDKKGRELLSDIHSDIGYTMPEIEGCKVHVYDYPAVAIKVREPATHRLARGWRLAASDTVSGDAWDVQRLTFMQEGEEISGVACSSGFALPQNPGAYGPQHAFVDGQTFWGGRANEQSWFMLGIVEARASSVDQIVLDQGQKHSATAARIDALDENGAWHEVGMVEHLRPGLNHILIADAVGRPTLSSRSDAGHFGPPHEAVSGASTAVSRRGVAPRHVVLRERDVGMFSLFLQVVNTLQLTEKSGTIPVAWFGEGCAYFHPDGYHGKRSVWEYYFEPLSEGWSAEGLLELPDPEKEAFLSNAIVTNEYYPSFASLPDEERVPYLSEVTQHHREVGSAMISKFIRPRRYISDKVDEFHREHLAGHHVVGMHLRGTDAIGSFLREEEVDVRDYINQAEAHLDRLVSDSTVSHKIFAASDDQKYIDALAQHFGSAFVCYDAIRKTGGTDMGQGPTGASMPDYLLSDRSTAAKNGEEVVIEYLLLCKSDYFIHNISSVSRAVLITRPSLERHNVQPYRTNDREETRAAERSLRSNPSARCPEVITIIQGGLPGSGLGSYLFPEVVGLIDDCLARGEENFVVIPKTDTASSYFPREGTPHVNLWSTFFEPINKHLLDCLDSSELIHTNYDSSLHVQPGRIKAWPFGEDVDGDLDAWFRTNRNRGHAIVSRYFTPRDEITQRVQSLWTENFGSAGPVLGLHMRGTDKLAAGGRRIVEPVEYIPSVESFMEQHPDGKIFVATDDGRHLDWLARMGVPVVCQEAFRSSGATGLFNLRYDEGPEEHGREVLVDIYALARCDFLVHGLSSVVEAAMYLNPDLHDRSINLEYEKPQLGPWHR